MDCRKWWKRPARPYNARMVSGKIPLAFILFSFLSLSLGYVETLLILLLSLYSDTTATLKDFSRDCNVGLAHMAAQAQLIWV